MNYAYCQNRGQIKMLYSKPQKDYKTVCLQEAERCLNDAEISIALAVLLIKDSHRYDSEMVK